VDEKEVAMDGKTIILIVIGVICIAVGLILQIKYQPTKGNVYNANRILISMGGACLVYLLPGSIDIKYIKDHQTVISAVSAVAVFLLLYYVDPPAAINRYYLHTNVKAKQAEGR
jgi:hypothetical protein